MVPWSPKCSLFSHPMKDNWIQGPCQFSYQVNNIQPHKKKVNDYIYRMLSTKLDMEISKVNFSVVTAKMIFKSPQLIILKVTWPSSLLMFCDFIVSFTD